MPAQITYNPDGSVDIHLDTEGDIHEVSRELAKRKHYRGMSQDDIQLEIDQRAAEVARVATEKAEYEAELAKRQGK